MRTPASPGKTLAAYPVICDISSRVADVDGYGHLNAIRIGQYYEEARASFYTVALSERPREARILVGELTFQYVAEGFWPGVLQVGTGIASLGNSSFIMGQGLFQNEKCIGLCKTVLVTTQSGKSVPMPDDLRAELMRQMIQPDRD